MSAEVLAAAFGEASIAMAVVDGVKPFRVRAANARFVAATIPGGSVENRPLRDLLAESSAGELPAALEHVAKFHEAQTIMLTWALPTRQNRHWEVTLSYLESVSAVLYMGRDVTDREERRRKLEVAHRRMVTVTNLAKQSASLDTDQVVSTAAAAASALCDGPAGVYLTNPEGALALVAVRGVSAEGLSAFPEVLEGGFRLLDDAIAAGATRSTPYLYSLPDEQRVLMRELRASWLAVTPVRGRRGAGGVIVTLWRRLVGPSVGDVPALELAAGQLALALEHARFYAVAEHERARLAAIVEQLPDAVWIADGLGRLTQSNSVGRRLFGLAPDDGLPSLEALATRVDLQAPAQTGSGDLGFGEALSGRTVVGRLYSLTRPETGEPAWLQVSAAPLHDREGHVTGAVSVATDVTDRRRAEEALRLIAEISAALTESLDYERALGRVARILVASLADCVLIDLIEHDSTLRRVAVACSGPDDSPLALLLERAGPDAFAGGEAATILAGGFTRFHPELTPAALGELARDETHLASLLTMQLRSYMAVPLVARGRTIGVIQLVTTAAGRRYGAADRALVEDLARRAATAVDNARLYHRAQEADRRKDEFLAVLSHELRTPLTPILTWVQLLKHDPDPAYIRQATAMIERNVRLQTTLINDLLDLTSIERGLLALELKPMDLREAILAALEIVTERATKKGIDLQRSLPDAALPVEGDASRLQQVFWNLLSNAIKFTPAGGRIALQMDAENGSAVVRVRDSGTGIAAEFLPHVFDMFRQQEQGTRRTYGGLGIGLALAKRLVERHGGTVQAQSDGVGRGAEFIVSLPMITASIEGADRSASRNEGVLPRLDNLRILIVEDIADTSGATRLMLESLGARVSTATDGAEALDRVVPIPPDVILCDLRMPRMDGFEFLRRLRADATLGRLPVIAVSGLASQSYQRHVEDVGFDGFLSKPFDCGRLAGTIAAVLSRRVRARAS